MSKYEKSNELLKRAVEVTPLGAQTYSKSYRYYCQGDSPAFIDRGEGCYLYDVDGNKFIDFVCALGPITIGYNVKEINDAVKAQLDKGISFSLQAEVEVDLAEKIIEIIPCAEMVRFVKNGGDATTAAIRLARAYTGRDLVALSGYHGMHDWSIGSTENNKGIPKDISNLTKTFEYNNIKSLEELFNQYPNEIGAVILEPIQANGPKDDFLQNVKELTHENGAVLIFDEVVSGFRYALGGASELYDVVPDMAAFGKGMGNGLPISAVAGKKEIMKQIEEGIFVSTTFGGEALSMAGSLAALDILEKPGTYEYIWNLGTILKEGLENLIDEYELNDVVLVSGLSPHCGVEFEDVGGLDYLDINSIYSQAMIHNGIITVGINNINLSHTEDEINAYLVAAEEAMVNIKKAIEQDSTEGILVGKKVDPVFKRNIVEED
ncbi:aminotransferase class III-fold pyridoxal phosphate-dependent enzyme [uncultured Methanobrevibacter sp.]|uniref:aminotransferase class III-fold pyridoxal phosphate-dependent enzyme n=1 Tax=uncultured Methanobrevibacter sp. TaxID=253161 RepID=UPI0025CE78E2|nr:aminotransferase class III-fold pyridoxal phosphate-dependent enzyme [uncultured Methanobrevibacter sp.]